TLSYHWHDDRYDRPVSDFTNDCGDERALSCLLHVAARSRTRLRHADSDHRGPERGGLSRSWRGNVECDPVSIHRRLVGYGAARRNSRNAVDCKLATSDGWHDRIQLNQSARTRWTHATTAR